MQQYALDMGAEIGGSRKYWVHTHQSSIRAEKYSGLNDAVNGDNDGPVERRVITPLSIYGSPRWYREAFQHAMTLVRALGKPDIILIFTTNPK